MGAEPHTCAMRAVRDTWRRRVDFPPMFGPVRSMNRAAPRAPRDTSLGTKHPWWPVRPAGWQRDLASNKGVSGNRTKALEVGAGGEQAVGAAEMGHGFCCGRCTCNRRHAKFTREEGRAGRFPRSCTISRWARAGHQSLGGGRKQTKPEMRGGGSRREDRRCSDERAGGRGEGSCEQEEGCT